MGYTTGSCAALAAKAAVQMLLTGLPVDSVEIVTPKGLLVETSVLEINYGENSVSCAVRKDAGDDPDITDRTLVFATVSKKSRPGIDVDGGIGIGRVTRPGLDQPVGAAAINNVPRKMIISEVQAVSDSVFYEGGMSVIISIPDGERLAKSTFNPKLGIDGGISVLGTTGIVEPMSTQALIDCIGLELRALAAEGHSSVVLTPGNYGTQFLGAHPFLRKAPTVKISNYIGDALDLAVYHGFSEILLVAHIGKLVKLAGGIMNTHSSEADCRMEIITAHAALAGADRGTVTMLMSAVSTDSCIEILEKQGLKEPVISSLLTKIQEQLSRRVTGDIAIGAVMFSNAHGLLGQTDSAIRLIDSIKRRI
jgi:cobalt-precorrin-5B (C1)-methyltransferase